METTEVFEMKPEDKLLIVAKQNYAKGIRSIASIVGGESTVIGKFKKSSLASVKKLWSRLILQKYPTCCRCKDAKSTDPAHIYGRGIAPELALHSLNGIGLCRRCHEICDHGPDRDEIYRVAKSIMGQKKFDELSEARYKPAPSLEESEKVLLYANRL